MSDRKDSLTLVVIGPKHAGKTVYLTALANCPGVTISDPATIEVLTLHWKSLKEGKTPPATAGTINDLRFTIRCEDGEQSYNLDVTIPDYDGHFAETLSKYEDSGDTARLRRNIAAADGFIVFMPVGDEDVETMEEMRHEIGSFIGVAREVFTTSSKVPVPLIIAVNKWDKSQAFKAENEDGAAEDFIKAKEIYQLIYDRLNSFFANVTVLPISAYGHQSEDGNPVPGAIAPYRVTEPIINIITAFFTNLQELVERHKDSKNFTVLADLLLSTESLWQRWPGRDYSALLSESLDHCYENLREDVSKATNLRQFDRLWQGSPNSALFEHYSPRQRLTLEKIKAPLEKKALKQKRVRMGVTVAILTLGGLIWYVTAFNSGFKKDYIEAINAEQQNKYSALSSFLNEYGASFLGKILGSRNIETARSEMRKIVDNAQTILDARMEQLNEITDSCARASDARLLAEFAREIQSIDWNSVGRLENLLKNSDEICQAKSRIETADSVSQAQEAKGLLADKPETPEVSGLKSLVEEKIRQLEEKERETAESARIQPIQESFDEIMRTKSLADAKDFIATYERDQNTKVQDMVRNMSLKLPEMLYDEMMEIIKRMTAFDDDNYAQLRALALSNQAASVLTPTQVDSIRSDLQELAAKVDAARIDELPERIASIQQLNTAIDKIKALINTSGYSMDGGLFEYQRPPNLETALKAKISNVSAYIDVLENGIVVNWEIHAIANNAIRLNCDNLIARDAKLSITFMDGVLPDQRPDQMQCRRLDGGRGYTFYTDGKVGPYSGSVQLKKITLIGNDKVCSSYIEVTNDDMIKLFNRETVRLDLGRNCTGITMDFSR